MNVSCRIVLGMLLCATGVLLNVSCASQNWCRMSDDRNAYDTLIVGKYRVFRQIPQEMIHVNSDFDLFLKVEDSLGKAVADSRQGRFYVQQVLPAKDGEASQGRLWISILNKSAHRYEVYGKFTRPGNWRLDIQFVKDSVDLKFSLPVMVMAEMNTMQHGGGSMQGHGGGCH